MNLSDRQGRIACQNAFIPYTIDFSATNKNLNPARLADHWKKDQFLIPQTDTLPKQGGVIEIITDTGYFIYQSQELSTIRSKYSSKIVTHFVTTYTIGILKSPQNTLFISIVMMGECETLMEINAYNSFLLSYVLYINELNDFQSWTH